MIHAQNTKVVSVIAPAAIGTTEVTGIIDTLGYEHVSLVVQLAGAATNASVASFSVGEADSGTSYTAIAALTGGTNAGNFTLPAGVGTGTAQVLGFGIRKGGRRKRYLQVTLSNSASRQSAVIAVLSRPPVGPGSAAAKGLTVGVNI